MLRNLVVVLLAAVLHAATSYAAYAAVRVEGRVVDQSGLALPGVTVRLVAVAGGTVQSAVTGANGEYAFEAEGGDYRLEASLDGFEPASREIRVAGATAIPDLVLALAHFSQETTVVGTGPTEVQPRQFGAPATIPEKVIDNAPLRTNRYDDVLPLLPNVVRGLDGLISVAGARAPQGIVLLNGVPGIDAANGEPIAPVPLAAVQSVQVITTGFPAEYGRSTGGVTVVNTRSGSDSLQFTANSFTPRPRIDDGGVRGIEAWQPNMGVRGPLVRGRAWFAQSLDYRFDRTKVDTLSGDEDRRLHALTSFTQLDAKVGASHVVTAWVSGQRERVNGAGLGAFTPLGTVPDLHRATWGGALVDRATVGSSSTIETRVAAARQDLSLLPVGSTPYVVGHDITVGSYFATLDRQAVSLQASTVFSRTWSARGGDHLLKAGASVLDTTLDGAGTARPAAYLRSTGNLARLVEFVGPGSFTAHAVDGSAFVQDTWTLAARFVADIGLRASGATRVGSDVEPRAGITWKPDDDTTVTAGAGLFSDKTPLAAFAFPAYQSRQVTLFDATGIQGLQASPVLFTNVLATRLSRARAWIWSGQVDRRLGGGWRVRAGYQERQGSGELLVVPVLAPAGGYLAMLTSDGTSRSRSLEATVGFRPPSARHQFYVSYVRSLARGNTNDFNQVEGTFREPLLEPAEEAPLPTDVPHRLLVWGLFSLPSEVTVAPFFEMRSGFPFSAVSDDWTYAGPRYSQRYPAFASLDLVVNKMVTLFRGVRARVGIKLYNLAGRGNGRDIQRDIDRPDFGQTYNVIGRQVRGVFEIVWSGTGR